MSTLAAVGLYTALFQVLWVIGAIVAAVFLILAYNRQRQSGFLWLLVATVVWPFLIRGASLGFTFGMSQLVASHRYTPIQFAMIQIVFNGIMQVVDVILLAIAAQRFVAGTRQPEPPVYPTMPPPVGEWPSR